MDANGQSVREVIFDTVSTYFNVPRDSLSDATTAHDIPQWDSVSHIPLMLEIEDRLGVEFPLEQLGSAENLGDLVVLGEQFGGEKPKA